MTSIVLCGCSTAPVHMDEALLAERERGNTGGENYGEFGPPDAYEDGSVHPFYGSENEWSRRMFSERAADLYYKRRGQRQMLEIIDGDPEAAIELATARLANDPRDAESQFIIAVAYAVLGDIERAFAATQAALQAGMPLERFLAGPRELLAPLTQAGRFSELMPARDIAVVHGPTLGAVTDSSARFWIRSLDETEFDVVLQSSKGTHVARGRTDADEDYTGVAIASGLAADTEYSYRIRVGGKVSPAVGSYRFRTARAEGTAGLTKIGFGGCAGYTPANERMWDTIASHPLQAFLFLGDNVYIDLPEMPGAFHQYSYYQRQSRPEFRRLVSRIPAYAIWDDHDAAFDDVWLGPYTDRPAWKQPMVNSFRQNWNNPSYGSASNPGTWFRFAAGDVEFFMLDGRTYRTNPFLESPSMLGPEQKAWLLDGLLGSTATFKVIASPVAWADGAKPGSIDTWSGFAAEREAIFAAIEQHAVSGVVLLSSDRHRSEAWRIERDSGYAFYDLLSGQLTNVHTHPVEEGALFSYNAKESFGVLTFDTDREDPELHYQIFSIDNELIETLAIRLSELQPKVFSKK
ncbi:MAG: alkaline phosphatase D family protein [Pseudomonadota bacterium]